MAVTKAKKTEQVEKLSGELKNVSSVIVATYSKLTVAEGLRTAQDAAQRPAPSIAW